MDFAIRLKNLDHLAVVKNYESLDDIVKAMLKIGIKKDEIISITEWKEKI